MLNNRLKQFHKNLSSWSVSPALTGRFELSYDRELPRQIIFVKWMLYFTDTEGNYTGELIWK